MNFFNKYSKKEVIIACIAILIFLGSIIFFGIKQYNDYHIPSVYYRTYIKEDGWSKWCKNGETSGDKKSDILNMEIKVKSKKSYTTMLFYVNNNWINSEEYKNTNAIYGLNLVDTYAFVKDFDLCYRTYNSKDKWLQWSCNADVSGNINEEIKGVEIKIIPRNVIRYDYLKDYYQGNEMSKGF